MAVMRSIMYVPGNNPKMVEKAPSIPADIITLDLEDSVPPSEKEAARKLVAEKLKYAGSGGAQVYVRINNWETEMTNDDLEAVVWEGLDGVTLAKTIRMTSSVLTGSSKNWNAAAVSRSGP